MMFTTLSPQWAMKGRQLVDEMVQRFRMWRFRGEILENPLLEAGRRTADTTINSDSNDSAERAVGHSGLVEWQSEAEELNDNYDDDSTIVEA
jgi:hypothetical protein